MIDSSSPDGASVIATASPMSGTRRAVALLAGPLLHLVLYLAAPESLGPAGRHTVGIAGWMALWWITEAVPLAATSLLPLALFPLLGVVAMRDAAAPYATELVFLFMGGFMLAAALEHWRAHVRIAYLVIAAVGTGARRTVFGVMLATGFVSMWISNTATAAMMYPIALAVGGFFGEGRDADRLRTALMLGVAYAASIGGLGTLLGTPPNLIFAGAARELGGREVGFVDFMMIGVPIAAVLLPVTWALLVFVVFRARVTMGAGAAARLREERLALGPLTGGERLTMIVFALTAVAWLVRERKSFGTFTVPGLVDIAPRLGDASIASAGALALFVLTGRARDGTRRPLLGWNEARRIPWDVLLLFGGGLSLAAAMESTGVARWLGAVMTGLDGQPAPVIYAGLALTVLVLSELASNTAVAAMAMPIAASLAAAVGQPPLALMLVAALAASAGFALPMATPPNAIVFGSGQVTVRQMAKAGVLVDAVAIALVVLAAWLLYPVVFG